MLVNLFQANDKVIGDEAGSIADFQFEDKSHEVQDDVKGGGRCKRNNPML